MSESEQVIAETCLRVLNEKWQGGKPTLGDALDGIHQVNVAIHRPERDAAIPFSSQDGQERWLEPAMESLAERFRAGGERSFCRVPAGMPGAIAQDGSFSLRVIHAPEWVPDGTFGQSTILRIDAFLGDHDGPRL